MPSITQISTHTPLQNWWHTSRQCHIFYWVLRKSFYLNRIFKICGSYSTQSFQNQQFQVSIFPPLIITLLGFSSTACQYLKEHKAHLNFTKNRNLPLFSPKLSYFPDLMIIKHMIHYFGQTDYSLGNSLYTNIVGENS